MTFGTDGGWVAVWNAFAVPLSLWAWKGTGEPACKYVFLFVVSTGTLALVGQVFCFLWVQVTVDAERGLVLPLGRVIPRESVLGCESRDGLFGWIRRQHSALKSDGGSDPIGGLILVFLPVFALAFPFHPRVVIRLKGGRIVLRSLDFPELLVKEIESARRRRNPP